MDAQTQSVLVTGVAGNLGMRLLPQLASYRVIGVDLMPADEFGVEREAQRVGHSLGEALQPGAPQQPAQARVHAHQAKLVVEKIQTAFGDVLAGGDCDEAGKVPFQAGTFP